MEGLQFDVCITMFHDRTRHMTGHDTIYCIAHNNTIYITRVYPPTHAPIGTGAYFVLFFTKNVQTHLTGVFAITMVLS